MQHILTDVCATKKTICLVRTVHAILMMFILVYDCNYICASMKLTLASVLEDAERYMQYMKCDSLLNQLAVNKI